MTTRHSNIQVTYTSRGLPRYAIEIWHDGLKKYQVVKGTEKHVVRQKAAAKMLQWEEQWEKQRKAKRQRSAREKAALDKERKKSLAEEWTEEAKQALGALERTLAHTLSVNDAIRWERLKNKKDYPVPEPPAPTLPSAPSQPRLKPEPTLQDSAYQLRLTLFDKLLASRRERKELEVKTRYEGDRQKWEDYRSKVLRSYEGKRQAHEEELKRLSEEHAAAVAAWEQDRDAYLKERAETNAAIDEKKQQYLAGEADAVVDYCDMVLSNSEYPDSFPQNYELDYQQATRTLVIDYQLPSKDALPT